MKKWTIGYAALAVLVITLAGCGTTAKSSSPTSSPSATTSQSSQPSSSASQVPTAAPTPVHTATPAPTPAGPTLTQQQQSAAEEAQLYLSTQGFSLQGLIDQLDSPYGSGYSVHDATVAVDSLTVNWNAEAVQEAKEYLQTQPFSCNNLIQQLDSPYGGKFTVAQATYGAQQAGDC